jgi:tetraacyldisaccharide 4'-kinase
LKRGWLAPLVPVYAAALAAKNAAYDSGRVRAKRLRWPVVSVGNLSVGGSGKTPLTIRLAELLVAAGFGVDVLSRGYGRTSSAVERVDVDGDAVRFGDEPLLIARRVGIPVFVGANRFEAGLLAEGPSASVGITNLVQSEKLASQTQDVGHPHSLSSEDSEQPRALSAGDLGWVHLLDDGFQHRRLFRDLDVVVVHRSDFEERLLPSGRLREPLTALRRADFVVIREEDSCLESNVREMGVESSIWWMRRSLGVDSELVETTERVVGFCGIARPEEFFDSLIALGVNLELTVSFGDHHRYTMGDMERLASLGARIQTEAFVTTEKDLVKLNAGLRARLEAIAPLRIARLGVSLRDEDSVARQIRDKLIAK